MKFVVKTAALFSRTDLQQSKAKIEVLNGFLKNIFYELY